MVATFASAKQFVVVGKEVTQGTAVAGTATIPVEKFEPEDKPVWLDDKAIRGSMVDSYGRQLGVVKTDFSMSGPCFADTLPWLLANIFGDVAYTGGTPTGSALGPLTVAATAGVTSVLALTSASGVAPGTVLSVDTAGLQETVTVLSLVSLNATLTAPVKFSHTTSATVTAVTAPWNVACSTQNSNASQGQPGSHTFTHYQGTPAGTFARSYPGACLSELNLKWNAETQLFQYDAKGSSWPSVIAAATPTAAPSAVTPVASWRGILGIAGPATGGTLVSNVLDGEINIKRVIEPVFTTQNSQNPYVIQRGAISISGKLNFIATSEVPYTTMLNNTQPQLQLILANGAAGAAAASTQIDINQAAYETSKLNTGKAAIGYDVTFMAEANTVNAGISGGYSPGKVTVSNAVAPNTYI